MRYSATHIVLIETRADALEAAVIATKVPDDSDSAWPRIYADLHDKQREAIDDPSPRKCFEKGRRAGGSWLVAAWLMEDYHRWAGHTSLFIALTKEHAKSILWPTLEQLNARYKLGIVFNGLDLSATFPNGFRILLKGAKDRSQVEKLRGIAGGLRRCAIDESGSFSAYDKQFRYLISSVIAPQFMDTFHLGGGQLVLSGSPGLDPAGLYYERCTGLTHDGKPATKWSTHHWTALHNPTLDAVEYLLQELRDGDYILDDTPPERIVEWLVELKGAPMDDERWAPVLCRLTAEFRREYLADWCKDTDSVIYIPRAANLLEDGYALDESVPWRVVVGCDVGWGDGNGFAVAAKSLRSRDIVLLEAYYLPEMSDGDIAAELAGLRQRYRAGEIYVDCGGEGDRLIANLGHFGVHAMAAGKGRKKPRIEYLRTVLANGSLKIRQDRCAAVLTEWSALPWSEDRQNHREGFVDDVCDAVLMAVNPLSQRFQGEKPRPPKKGEEGWAAYQAKLERAAADRMGRRQRRKRTRGELVEMFPGVVDPIPLAA